MNKLLILYILSFFQSIFYVCIPVIIWLIYKYYFMFFDYLYFLISPFGIPKTVLVASYIVASLIVGVKVFNGLIELSFLFSEYKEKIQKDLKQTENLS